MDIWMTKFYFEYKVYFLQFYNFLCITLSEFSSHNITLSFFWTAVREYLIEIRCLLVKSNKIHESVSKVNVFNIKVLWSAPPPGSGCVALRATVSESREVWYSEDGPLSKVLCEEVQENEDIQPNILRQCCACDEAKYEVSPNLRLLSFVRKPHKTHAYF